MVPFLQTFFSTLLIFDSVLFLCVWGVFSHSRHCHHHRRQQRLLILLECPCPIMMVMNSYNLQCSSKRSAGHPNRLSIYLYDMFYILWISSLIKHLLQEHRKMCAYRRTRFFFSFHIFINIPKTWNITPPEKTDLTSGVSLPLYRCITHAIFSR